MFFSKYHGCGNHFIIIREEEACLKDYSKLAKKVCDPSTGIGGDGFIVVREDPLEMLFYNMDGTEAPMCGNGIRCFAHFCSDQGICNDPYFSVKTGSGTMHLEVTSREPFLVKVNMGKPEFSPQACAIGREEEPFLHRNVGGQTVSSFFMGTVHTVIWTDEFAGWEALGEEISNHPIYREKTNVNFALITGDDTATVKTYERGVGPTQACGTGACAVAVLGWHERKFKSDVTIQLPCGNLIISQGEDNDIFMKGPSHQIFTGAYRNKGEE